MPVRRPRVGLKLFELEDRRTPAWWSVTAPDPAEGWEGITDAAHFGDLFAHPDELPDGNGGLLVEADTAEEAVGLAVAGVITVELAGETVEYAFGPSTVGTSVADERPFLVGVSGDEATVSFEDLVGFPGAANDWDYDDRSWQLGVTKSLPPDNLIDSGKFVWSEMRTEVVESVTVHFRVTSEDDGQHFRWQYRLVNSGVTTDPPGVSVAEYPGVHAFRLLPEGLDLSDADQFAATNGWESRADPYDGLLTWSPAGGWPGPDRLPVGGEATFCFRTPPRPVGEGRGRVEADSEVEGLEGSLKVPASPPAVSIDTSKLIPINADNDNFKPIVVNGVATNEADRWLSEKQPFSPKVRDYKVDDKIWKDDEELLPVTLIVAGTDKGGVLSASVVGAAGGGTARLFNKPNKDGGLFTSVELPITLPNGNKVWSKTVYIEGTHESKSEDDVKVTATFTQGNIPYKAPDKSVSITPVIKKWEKVIPSPKSVNFGTVLIAPPEPAKKGLYGITAGARDNAGKYLDGITFTATALSGTPGQPLTLAYVQNLTAVASSGAGAEVTLASGATMNTRLRTDLTPKPNWPLLDVLGGAQTADINPLYGFLAPPAVAADGVTVTVKMADSPGIGQVTDPASQQDQIALNKQLSRVEQLLSFRTYLVVRFPDQSIYPIARWEWEVEFNAVGNDPTLGLLLLSDKSQVRAPDPWAPFNNPIPKTRGYAANVATVVE